MYIYGISQINQVNMICQIIWNLEYNFDKPSEDPKDKSIKVLHINWIRSQLVKPKT